MSEISYKTCAAGGCPADGCMSDSAKGSDHWYCANHFGCDPNRVHEITAALVRFNWLVQLCKGIRHDINTGVWTELAATGFKGIAEHQRSDLYQREGTPTTRPETSQQWLYRLEDELRKACAPASPQQPLNV